MDWERPRPAPAGLRRDLLGAVLLTLIGWVGLALTESFAGVMDGRERWWGYAVIAVVTLPLAWRRHRPVTALAAGTVAYMAGAYINGQATLLLSTQVAYFAYVYAAVAWGKSRHVVAVVVVLLVIVMGLWLLIDLTISSSYRDYVAELASDDGPLDPLTGYTVYLILVNIAFFAGAVYAGRSSWRSALSKQRNHHQAQTIERQSEELMRRAVVDERLRIARELHDVVAHHVSAIGIQAGAARMVLTRDVEAAQEALRTVESSSRQAVTETRQLLGVLRDETGDPTEFGAHGAQDLEALVQEYAQRGLSVTLELDLDESLTLDRIPPALGSSVYRCVQESLANVLRHSTARRVWVGLSSRPAEHGSILELEVMDRGHPRAETSGSGFGLVGLRERAQLHGGSCQAGPRRPGPGWLVLVTFPVNFYTDDAETAGHQVLPAMGKTPSPQTKEV